MERKQREAEEAQSLNKNCRESMPSLSRLIGGFCIKYLGRTSASMYRHHLKQSMDQPVKVANPARGQLNRKS